MRRRSKLLGALDFGDGDTDFFLVSFPRSGNTWVRVMLAYLISREEEIAFHNLWQFIPDTDQPEQLQVLDNPESRINSLPVRILKSHDYFFPYYVDKKVIYVVRNGIDSITSYYHYSNARTHQPYSPDLFIKGNTAKIRSWRKHLLGWQRAQENRVLVVRYEDVAADPVQQLGRMASFLGLDVTPPNIQDAVGKADFNRMRQLEDKHGYYNDNRTEEGKNSPFVREGQVAGKSDVFTEEQIELFRKLSRKAAARYGYDLF